MKPVFLALLVGFVLLAGCVQNGSTSSPTPSPQASVSIQATPTASVTASIAATPTPSASPSPAVTASPSVTQLKCQVDSDCVTDGCSGQICRSKLDESVMTTCEWKEEYACYKKEGCLCQSGQCAWSAQTTACVQSASSNANALPPQGEGAAFEASRQCVGLCETEKAKGRNLSAGPCLSNQITPDWVCDVAHDPRQDVDNLEQNTCPAFGVTAQHFVEVDENCRVIFTE